MLAIPIRKPKGNALYAVEPRDDASKYNRFSNA